MAGAWSISEAQACPVELLPARVVMSIFRLQVDTQVDSVGDGNQTSSGFTCDVATAFTLAGMSGLTPEEQACVERYAS